MKEKKVVAFNLLDAIEALALSREEITDVAKEMVARFALTPSDCFSPQESSAVLTEKKEKAAPQTAAVQRKGFSKNGVRLGRPPKNGSRAQLVLPVSTVVQAGEDKEPVAQSDTAEIQQLQARKGYSKNGKRLGRPPRKNVSEVQKVDDTLVSIQPEKTVKSHFSAIDGTLPAEKEDKPMSFEEEVEKLKYGREYALDALYLYKGRMVRTNRVMTDARPLGVFIPHLRRCGYKEFLLYYVDETAGLTLNMAMSYARNKLPKYQDQPWKIKEPWYDGAIKEVLEEANVLLKKMGGDKFEGKYFNPKETYYGFNADVNRKFRYVCDVI
uniref:Uncharacterized protein n=1 Tax=uncultured Alphaproteobacteria bacterium TaxID=91750 RepID=A0A6G8F219_9PROT|nr:hypothetical protein PlAlph_0880 [uncultured Alphaproteobacteria bacterium]